MSSRIDSYRPSDQKRTVLYIAGLPQGMRARDIGHEFEKFGPLVRCDVPAPPPNSQYKTLYAFVEFEMPRDAERAFDEMNHQQIDGYTIMIQWAKTQPLLQSRGGRSFNPPPYDRNYQQQQPRRYDQERPIRHRLDPRASRPAPYPRRDYQYNNNNHNDYKENNNRKEEEPSTNHTAPPPLPVSEEKKDGWGEWVDEKPASRHESADDAVDYEE